MYPIDRSSLLHHETKSCSIAQDGIQPTAQKRCAIQVRNHIGIAFRTKLAPDFCREQLSEVTICSSLDDPAEGISICRDIAKLLTVLALLLKGWQ